MRTWLKALIWIAVVLAVLLALNTVVTDHQTKDAESITEAARDGATILPLVGGDLKVVDTGAGAPIRGKSPIVLLHCYTCAIDWWQKVMPLLRKRHRVIAIDLLGHGGSEKPRSGYSMQDQAQLVAAALARLGVRDATVVGHSLGGAVAIALAEQSPDLVNRLAILDTEPDTSYGSLGLLARAAYSPVLGEALWRVKTSWAIRRGLEQAFAPGYDVPDAFVDDVKRMTYSSYEKSASGFDDYVNETPLDERAQKLGLPLLVIFGAEDQIVDARPALSAYAAVPGVQTELIPGSGHSPAVEKPARTAALILRFASSVPTSQSPGEHNGAAAPRKAKTVGCDDLALAGAGRAASRRQSAVAGPFSLFGAGRDFRNAEQIGGVLESKLPATVAGHRPVTVFPAPQDRDRVGFVYGGFRKAGSIAETASRITFVPCRDKPRTVWPGALALVSRKRVTLEVKFGDSTKTLRIG